MNMKAIMSGLKVYYKQTDGVERIISDCALAAAAASAVGSSVPVLAIPATIVSSFGAVWVMYAKICKHLEINISENKLKLLARAVLTNLATNLAGLIAGEIVLAFIPGASILASAVLTFCSIYLAGMMFSRMLLNLAQKGLVGSALDSLDQSTLKSAAVADGITKEDLRAAKAAYTHNK